MARVQVIGPRPLLGRAIAFLQARGVLQLRAPSAATGPGGHRIVEPCAPGPDAAELQRRLEEAVARATALLGRLPPAPDGERAEALPDPASGDFAVRVSGLEREVAGLEARRTALAEERAAADRFERLVVALAPLRHGLDPALAPEIHALVLRPDPEALALLEGEVRRLTGGVFELESRPLPDGQMGVLLAVPRAASRELTALLFERGVDEVKLPPAYAGKGLVELLLLLAARQRAIPAELAAAEVGLERVAARFGTALGASAHAARAALLRLRAAARCGATRFAFVVTGWMPEEGVPALRDATRAELGDAVALVAARPEPAEWPDVPVVLRNRPAIRPFERLLALVALPRYGSTDPTPWLAVFFPLFFGLVLGDVAFGLLGIGVSLAARRRRWGGAAGRDLAWIALACSASAAAFGLLFGEALGELGRRVGLRPLLLDRRDAILPLLALALAVGLVHVLAGMALGVGSALRGGHRREAVGRAAKLGLLVAGGAVAAALLGPAPRALAAPAGVAAAALLAIAVAAEGPMAALDLVLGLGNVLSYARLMALGLASAMLAEVANHLAGSLRPAAAGVAAGVLLHAVNYSLGLVSPTIAALRLHYVEFFEKFYDEGGEPYRPFAATA
ncbi:MAG TPA: ATPase [Anaeromyxobacteraceae bacterium]|nr:ATPase [Anaeromyxobacteraceae bacterium]